MSDSHSRQLRSSLPYKLLTALGFCRPLDRKRRAAACSRLRANITKRDTTPVIPGATILLYREMIEHIRHENELIHQRTTWFLAIQGVLAAGAGVVYTSQAADAARKWIIDSGPYDADVFKVLSMWAIVCLTGCVTAAVGRSSIDAALHAQDTIDEAWTRVVPAEDRACLPDMMGGKGDYEADIGGGFAGTLPQFVLIVWWAILIGPLITKIAAWLLTMAPSP